jgi:hypothetical protein
MNHQIALSERAERALAEVAARNGLTAQEYIERHIEAWAAHVADGAMDPEQAWFWTPEWQAGELAADADMAAGRGTRYESDEEFLAALEARVGDPAETEPDADA